jgi:hypothetical protein
MFEALRRREQGANLIYRGELTVDGLARTDSRCKRAAMGRGEPGLVPGTRNRTALVRQGFLLTADHRGD